MEVVGEINKSCLIRGLQLRTIRYQNVCVMNKGAWAMKECMSINMQFISDGK